MGNLGALATDRPPLRVLVSPDELGLAVVLRKEAEFDGLTPLPPVRLVNRSLLGFLV